MSAYWFTFIVPMLAILSPVKLDRNAQGVMLWIFGAILILLIGFRYEVGGDWDRYLFVYDYIFREGGLIENSAIEEFGYELVYWLSVEYFDGIYTTNFIEAIIFVTGLIYFCRAMPMPWVALLASIPFLVTIVSMAYTRQAFAVGFLLMALVQLSDGKTMNFLFLIMLGTLFHNSLIIMAMVGFFYNSDKNLFKYLLILSGFILVSVTLLFAAFENLIYIYFGTQYFHSEGAIMRALMSALSGVILLMFRGKFKETYSDYRLWLIFSIGAILLFITAFFFSTFADRIAIYFLPLQLVVFSRFPILISSTLNRTLFIVGFIMIYASSLFVWLNFGKHAFLWIPYNNVLLGNVG